MKRIKRYLLEIWRLLRLPEMLILPGNLAFFLLLSLFPIITLFGAVASSLSLSMDGIINSLNGILPVGVAELIVPFITGSGFTSTNVLFIIIGFYLASNGPDSIITASNIVYQSENKNYVFRRIKAIFMTFWLMFLFIIILVFLAFGSFILKKILTFGALGEFISNHYMIITFWKLLLAFFFTFVVIKIIYTMAPDKQFKSKYVNKGAFFATLAIMIVTAIYSFYATNIAHYDVFYGNVANVAILMLLIYIISYIIVLGIAINHNSYQLDKIDTNES